MTGLNLPLQGVVIKNSPFISFCGASFAHGNFDFSEAELGYKAAIFVVDITKFFS